MEEQLTPRYLVVYDKERETTPWLVIDTQKYIVVGWHDTQSQAVGDCAVLTGPLIV